MNAGQVEEMLSVRAVWFVFVDAGWFKREGSAEPQVPRRELVTQRGLPSAQLYCVRQGTEVQSE